MDRNTNGAVFVTTATWVLVIIGMVATLSMTGSFPKAFGFLAVVIVVFIFGGSFVLLPENSEAIVGFLQQPWRRLIAASSRGEGARPFGNLFFIGPPFLFGLISYESTELVRVKDDGEPEFEKRVRRIVSLKDQIIDLIFLGEDEGLFSKNQIRMHVTVRLAFRVVEGWRAILFASDWLSLVAKRVSPIIRQAVTQENWPEISGKREALMQACLAALANPNRPTLLPGGAPDPRDLIKFLLEEYGVYIESLEVNVLQPAEQDVIDAGETKYKREQEASGLQALATAYADDGVRRAKVLEMVTAAFSNTNNTFIHGIPDVSRQVQAMIDQLTDTFRPQR